MGYVIAFVFGAFFGALAYVIISKGLVKEIVKDVKGKV